MLEDKSMIMRALRLAVYPSDHITIDSFVSGMVTTYSETMSVLRELEHDGEIFMDRKDVYLIKNSN